MKQIIKWLAIGVVIGAFGSSLMILNVYVGAGLALKVQEMNQKELAAR